MEFESQLPYEIVFIRKRSSSATFREGKIMLRISSYLSAAERIRHCQELLDKLNNKLSKSEPQIQLLEPLFTNSTLIFFDDKTYTFFLKKDTKSRILLEKNRVIFTGRKWPAEISFYDAISQNILTKKDAARFLLAFCEQEYLSKVSEVIYEWQEYINTKKPLRKVEFSTMNTRWGTCSSKGIITIAAKTLLLPEALFESICVHEVAHLDQMNHGKNFWKQVLSVLPNYKELQKELKKYH